MRYWSTKYALSAGIKEIEAEPGEGEYVYTLPYLTQFRVGRDCHVTWWAAVAWAEQMRIAKIASLRRQILKLERLRFEP